MSIQTNPDLRRSVIYELYVRSHTPQGTFRAVEPDLPRIRALGTDILWLMPIHPIGQENRKGSMGCPYANRDYRTVNPEYGTLEDFLHLVDAIHDNGMKCIIDVVYNHTSPDSTLVHRHRSISTAGPTASAATRWATGPMWWTWTMTSPDCGTIRSSPCATGPSMWTGSAAT